MKISNILGLFLLLAAGCARVHLTAESPVLEEKAVAVGDIDFLSFENPTGKTTVSNYGVIEAEQGRTAREIRIIPLKKGAATLVVADPAGKTLRVIHYNCITNQLMQKYQDVVRLLKNVADISVSIVGEKIVVDGKVQSSSDRERIASVASAFENILDLTSFEARESGVPRMPASEIPNRYSP